MAAEEIPVLKSSIKYKDVHDLKEFYKLVYFWLRDNDWIDPDYDDIETLTFERSYLQKEFASGAKDHIIKWEAQKDPHESKYFLFKLSIKFSTLQIKDVEVMHENRKLKANIGELKFDVSAKLVVDPKGEWNKNAFVKHFQELWKKRIYKDKISKHKEELREEAEALLDAAKKYLDLKGFLLEQEQEPFYESKSYG